MNRKILVTVLALAVVLLATPLVSAVPYIYPKNNDKFQAFEVTGTFSFLTMLSGEHQWIPSFDVVNKYVISFDESMLTYEITVDGHTYHLGTDFTYTGHAVFTFLDPVFGPPFDTNKLYPTAYHGYEDRVYYMYSFLPASGIDGTIQMLFVANNGANSINSLAGTGDLRNVQIKATTWDEFNPVTLIVTIHHEGIVSGWPT